MTFNGRSDPVAILKCDRHGLLQQDVLLCRSSAFADIGMAIGLAGHDHSPDSVILEDSVDIGEVAHPKLFRRAAHRRPRQKPAGHHQS